MELSGSYHPITKLAFLDELEKISREVSAKGREHREKTKKFLKGSLALAAGSAAGVGTYMVGDRFAKKVLGSWWSRQPSSTKEIILATAGTGATLGTAHFAKKLLEEKRKHNLG